MQEIKRCAKVFLSDGISRKTNQIKNENHNQHRIHRPQFHHRRILDGRTRAKFIQWNRGNSKANHRRRTRHPQVHLRQRAVFNCGTSRRMKSPKHRFRVVSASGSTFSTRTTLRAAESDRKRMLPDVSYPNILQVQQWDVSEGSWKRPDQMVEHSKCAWCDEIVYAPNEVCEKCKSEYAGGRGGKREGAGRKPRKTPREAITVRLEPQDAAKLRGLCKARGVSQADWITEKIRRSRL